MATIQSQNNDLEYCCVCDEPIGNAGRGEGTLYCEFCGGGPYCESCYDEHLEEAGSGNQ